LTLTAFHLFTKTRFMPFAVGVRAIHQYSGFRAISALHSSKVPVKVHLPYKKML
jgi:hypothetical protein